MILFGAVINCFLTLEHIALNLADILKIDRPTSPHGRLIANLEPGTYTLASLTLQSESVSLVGPASLSQSESNQLESSTSLFIQVNTSLCLARIHLELQISNCSVASLDSSSISFMDSEMSLAHTSSPFIVLPPTSGDGHCTSSVFLNGITIILPSNSLKNALVTLQTLTQTGTTPGVTLTSTSLDISSFQFGSEQGIFSNHIKQEDISSLPTISVSCSASSFHNISSLPTVRRATPTSTQTPEYLLTGISYTDSENGFYGLLTPNINHGGDFIVTNSTFSRCLVDATGQTYTETTPKFDLASSSTFANCNFTAMTSIEDGGSINFNSPAGTLSITGCNFTDCTVSTSYIFGGAIFVATASSVSIENTRFVRCQSEDGYGGGFAVNNTTIVTMDLITCDTCEALDKTGIYSRGGGGFVSRTEKLILSNSQFLNCLSDANGGGFAIINISSSAEISSTHFTSCQSMGNGGGLDISDCTSPSTITLTTVIFTRCEVTLDDDGGGLSAEKSNQIVLDTCQFVSCSAKGRYKYGGGSYFRKITIVDVIGSTFQDCVAKDGFGGGLSFETGGCLSVTNSFFTRCLAKSNTSSPNPADARGGGIRVTTVSGKVYLNKVTFVGCEAAKEGGGLFVDEINQLEMTSCDFTDCRVEDDSLNNCFGGAVFAYRVAGTNTITKCKFTNCYAGLRGGAIYADDTPSLTVDDCDFDTCVAERLGGGTCTYNVPIIEIKNSRFVSCEAKWGGGVFEEYLSGEMICITVSGNNFTECNTTQEHGGAIWIENYPATQILTNNLIKQCTSTLDGGGIAVSNGQDITISDSQFISCESGGHGGGLTVNQAQDVTLSDSQFISCVSAGYGGGVHFTMSQGHFMISRCFIKSCIGVKFGGGIFLKLKDGSEATFLIDSVEYGIMPEEMNTVVDGDYGSNLFFDLLDRSDVSFINPNTIQDPLIMTPANGISFTEDELKKWAYRTDYTTTTSILYLIHPYVGGSLAVNSNQYNDPARCGDWYLPCQDFTVGHANAKDSATGEKAGVFIHTDVTTAPPSFDKDMIWESSESNPKNAMITSGSVSPGSYSLTLKSLIFSRTTQGTSLFSITTGSLSVTSCTFTGRSSTTNGGAISATITTNTLTIASSSFKKWITEGFGGGIFIDATGLGSGGGFDVSGCEFGTGGDRNSATKGDNVYVSGKDFENLITTAKFPSVSGSTSPTLYWGNDEEHSVDSTLLVYLVPIGSTATIDSLSGKDIPHCGHFGVGCQTIETGFSRISGNPNPLSLILTNSVTVGAGFSVSSGKEISIKKSSSSTQTSASHTNPVLTFTSSTTFTISLGTLSFEEVELEVKVTTSSNAFVVSGGTLELGTSCSLSFSGTSGSLISQTKSLFKVSGGTLKIAGTSGEPKVIEYVDMGSSSVVEVNNVGFSGTVDLSFLSIGHCKSSSHGMISFLSSPSSSASPTVSIHHCFFSLNENLNAETGPHDIEADASWESVLNFPSVFVETYSDSTINHFQIGSNEYNTLVPFSILKTHGELGNDDSDCYLNSIMCKTVTMSLSHCTQKSGSTFVRRVIQMETGTFSEDTLVVGEKNVVIRGQTTAVVLQPSSDVSLLTLSSGTAELKTFTLAAFTTQSNPVISVTHSAGRLLLIEISFDGSGKTLSDSVVSTKGTTTITACSFSDVTCSSPNRIGSVITSSATTSDAFQIDTSSFSRCTVEGREAWIVFDAFPSTTSPFTSSLVDEGLWKPIFNETSPRSAVSAVEPSAAWNETVSFNPYSLIYLFHRSNSSCVAISKTLTSEDHPLCGHEKLPCLTVDGAIRTTHVKTVLVISTVELVSPLNLNGDAHTISGKSSSDVLKLIRTASITNAASKPGGTLTITSLTVDASSVQNTETHTVFDFKSGAMTLTSVAVIVGSSQTHFTLISLTDTSFTVQTTTISKPSFSKPLIVLSQCPALSITSLTVLQAQGTELISISDCPASANAVIKTSKFTGVLSSNDEDFCHWESGLIGISNCSIDIDTTSFATLSQGALNVVESNISLMGDIFADNVLTSVDFPSAERNLRCSGISTINIVGNEDLNSLWFLTNKDCVVKHRSNTITATLFVPTLLAASCNSTYDKKGKSFSVVVVGERMVPCGLFLEIYEFDNKMSKEDNTITIELNTSTTTSITDTNMSLSISHSSLTNLSTTVEWRARLLYADNITTQEFFTISGSGSSNKSEFAKALPWLIPVIVIAVLLLVFIVIVLIVLLHRMRKKNTAQEPLLSTQEPDVTDKVEVDDDAPKVAQNLASSVIQSINQNGTTAFIFEHPASEKKSWKDFQPQTQQIGLDELVKAVRCDEGGEVVMVKKNESLFNRIHCDNPQPISKEQIALSVVKALKHIQKHHTTAETLTRLNSHWILFDKDNQMCLRLNDETNPVHASQSAPKTMQETSPEDQRWEAPEIANKEDGQTVIDPFKEVDAINAARNIGAGQHPKMETLTDSKKQLIERCMNFNPYDRLSLDELETELVKFTSCVAQDALTR
ncbi:hypothetical protein BLNAU_24030 [Blattamonas nauphoetae]|uniref:Uncharacterized protein n=1 Tax=Blattamonas nauphoetae TaxID=2049346 RepID=A0ABQ9WNL3_9EUKA|nr:hypothetical protein BLNAU_24030 [Blattamonas nauphoetae]